jgi:hypothetical protein
MIVLLEKFEKTQHVPEELVELNFWQQNFSNLFIKKELPSNVPPIKSVQERLEALWKYADYYDLYMRIKSLRKLYNQ